MICPFHKWGKLRLQDSTPPDWGAALQKHQSDWPNLRPKPPERAHAPHCLDAQDQEAGWLRKKNENKKSMISYYTQIVAYPSHHERGFLQQLMGADGEAYSQTLGRAWRTPEKTDREDYRSQRGQGQQENMAHKINWGVHRDWSSNGAKVCARSSVSMLWSFASVSMTWLLACWFCLDS